jgi:Isochorismatase family.
LNIFDYVIATKFKNTTNSSFENILNWSDLKTDQEQQINEKIINYVNLIVDKNVYSCVDVNFIQQLISINNGELPEQVYIAGLDTDCYVLTTAVNLFEYGIRPIILTEYCNSTGGDLSHEYGLICLKRLIGKKQICNIKINNVLDLEDI